MVRVDDDAEIPESGAVFTFGKSRFSENIPSKFWIRNDSIKQVACGDEHTIIVTGNGRVYVFGNNDWGQLGVGKTKTVSKPTVIKSLKHEKAISAAGGRSHTLVVTESGKVYAFGANGEGQLGLGDTTDRSEPCIINALEELPVKTVAAGSYHSAVVTNSGKLYIFGSNSEGQLGLGNDLKIVSIPTELQLAVSVSSIACGYYHTAVIGDGKVYTFGEKEGGKLGLLEKQLMNGSSMPQCIFSIAEKVAAVSCGGNHSAVVTECGKLYTFGLGLNGQLGLGTMVMETGSPSLVGALNGRKVIAVSCGESHTAIITDEGKLYTCGDGRHGKLGLGNENFSNQFNPVYIKKFSDFFVHEVACGGCHMLVLALKRSSDDTTAVVVSEPKDNYELSDTHKNSDLGVVARSRRRHKDVQEQPHSDTDSTGPSVDGFDLHSNQNVELKQSDDFSQSERELKETVKEIVNNIKEDQHKSIDTIDSSAETNPTNEIADKSDNVQTIAAVSNFNSTGSKAEKDTRSEGVIKSDVKDLEKEIEESQEEEEEEEGSTSEDDDDEVDTNVKDEMKNVDSPESTNNDQSQKAKENKLKTNDTNSSTDNSNQKKESFLKKIFSFKKKKSKLNVTEKAKEDSEINSVVATADPVTSETLAESVVSPSNESKSAPNLEQSAGVSDSENSKKNEESGDQKVNSAKSVKEKSNAANNHSSKTCRIL